MADDFPDPSATRVDGVYWATATSSLPAPGFPLMRSLDLVHWEPAGTIFPHIPAWADGELWAPEIFVDERGTLVYFTARHRGGGLCVGVASAPGPAGPYTDHGPLVCQRAGSIDPTVVRDAAGRPYLVWKEDGNTVREPSRIWIKRLRRSGIGVIGQLATAQGGRGWLREAKRRLDDQRAHEARPIERSRPKRLKEAKRRLEEELFSQCQANKAYENYRARGVMKNGRRLGKNTTPKPGSTGRVCR